MMASLFSVFDPSTSDSSSMNWVGMLLFLLFIPSSYWVVYSKLGVGGSGVIKGVMMEVKASLFNFNKFNIIIFLGLFIFIILNNFISLFPYIFTSMSHISITVCMSLMVWFIVMIYGWGCNMNHMFIHLTPQGTPYILMFFMVLIEFISSVIRPLTLSVRLSANIIAGHLLITLMSGSIMHLSSLMVMSLVGILALLMMLEVAVAGIQSYVYCILSTLYSSEVNYENKV